ncbi:farnesol dehydrogenase-like [Anastrepha obliqua]|uniref:farnesol dehydrogenase-like n=1 Tax=Anastrepha obliqua TaxID=95512 RepID=UPI0024099658|nr:farnesol dehydrogenase-like [Anastrepha obliqua]
MCSLKDNRSGVALVTGASSGIGAQISVFLANKGITVLGLARRVALVENLNAHVLGGGRIVPYHCDLTSEDSIFLAFEYLRNSFPPLTILVCNAGILKSNFLAESPGQDIKELFDVNVVGTSICLREGLKLLRETKTKGHFIVMNSILGHHIPNLPVPLFSAYPATKHAITALCQTVRQEIKYFKLNIKLTSISPGLVDTDLLNVYSDDIINYPKLTAADVANAVMFALNTPNYVQVEEIIIKAMDRYDE